MKCSKCGKRISKKFKLCPNCGTKVEIKKEVHKISKKPIFIVGGVLLLLMVLVCFIIFNNKVDFEKLKSSVVMINVYDSNNELIATGSGVVAFQNDVILTNAHVIEDNYKIEVISENNTKYQVEGILDYNKKKDIAILKLASSKGLEKVKIGKKEKIGNDITAIGSPLGLKNTISTGIISAKFQDNIEVYQHTAPISPGSSGGALFNSEGKLIGITYASITSGQNLNLAIPIEYYEKEYNKVKDNDIIDSRYYKYLNSSIIKTSSGFKLLQYVLNDKYGNEEDYLNHSCITHNNNESTAWCYEDSEEDVYKEGYISYSTKPLLLGALYDVSSYIKSYVYLLSGNSGVVISFFSDSKHKYLLEPDFYSIEIYKVNNPKYIDKVKAAILEEYEEEKKHDEEKEIKNDNLKRLEKHEILSSDNYVGVYSCVNYDDCDAIKKLVEDIVNQK